MKRTAESCFKSIGNGITISAGLGEAKSRSAAVLCRKEPAVRYRADFSQGLIPGKGQWQVMDLDAHWWAKRQDNPGYLTLYTLTGDNWPDTRFSLAYNDFFGGLGIEWG